jgi:hypothetical protein
MTAKVRTNSLKCDAYLYRYIGGGEPLSGRWMNAKQIVFVVERPEKRYGFARVVSEEGDVGFIMKGCLAWS